METTKQNKQQLRADLKKDRRKAAKPLMYTGIVSIVMLFAGLTSAYVVRANNGKNWLVFDLPDISILSTGIIVASSVTLFLAQRAARRDNNKQVVLGLALTLALGIAFLFTQIEGWKQLTAQGVYFVGKYSSASGSFLYLIAFVHLLHLAGGLVALCVSLVKSILRRYTAADHLGLDLTAIYWHFLDFLWVYLFLFLYNYR